MHPAPHHLRDDPASYWRAKTLTRFWNDDSSRNKRDIVDEEGRRLSYSRGPLRGHARYLALGTLTLRHSWKCPKINLSPEPPPTTVRNARNFNVRHGNYRRHVRASREPRHEGAGPRFLQKDYPHLGRANLQPQGHIAVQKSTHSEPGHAPQQSCRPHTSRSRRRKSAKRKQMSPSAARSSP